MEGVGWIGLIIAGAIIGVLARFLLPGPDPIGLIGTILVGVVGVLLGAWLFDMLLPNNDNQGIPWIAGIVTAIILLVVYRKVAGNRRTVT